MRVLIEFADLLIMLAVFFGVVKFIGWFFTKNKKK